ncbi:hypothetical protein KAH55_02080 [bacterium]|nr:hypothetical protein [bacterium]
MVSKYIILPLLLIIMVMACTPTPIKIAEPESDKMLVIGAVVVEDDYFTPNTGVHLDDIEVAVLAEYVKDGKLKTTGYWARTDPNGYFYLTNVPRGNYALTGLRFILTDGSELVIFNSLTSPDDNFRISEFSHIGFIGNYFDIEPHGSLINLQTNYFSLDEQSRSFLDVKYFRRKSIDGIKMVDGNILEMVPTQNYFLRKLGGTGWARIIEESRND